MEIRRFAAGLSIGMHAGLLLPRRPGLVGGYAPRRPIRPYRSRPNIISNIIFRQCLNTTSSQATVDLRLHV